MPPRSWSRAWRKASWTRLLSGLSLSRSRAARGVASLRSSLRASLVNRGRARAKAKAKKTRAGSGLILLGSFAKYDPESSCWRTFHRSLFEEESLTFSETWPRSGCMRNGACYPRDQLVPLTDARASSSWPTPTEGDSRSSGSRNLEGSSANPGVSLSDFVLHGGSETPRTETAARSWSTPTIADAKGPGPQRDRGKPPLCAEVKRWDTDSSHPDPTTTGEESPRVLNPRFVEGLLGWPIGWTGSGPVGMESFRSWLRTHSDSLLREG